MANLMMTNLSSSFAASFFLSDPDVVYTLNSPANVSDNASMALDDNVTTEGPALARSVGLDADDMAVLEQMRTAEMYLSTVVISFGIVCNVLTLLTLQDPDLKEPPYTYLNALSVADLSALILALCKYLVEIFKEKVICTSYAYCLWSAYFYYPFTNVAVTMTTWIMVVMTVERCLYVQFPFRVRTHYTNKQTRIKIMLVFLGSFVINFPRILWYKPHPLPQQVNASVSTMYTFGRYLHGTRFAVVITWIHSAMLHCLPLVLLIFLNAFLIYKFHHERCRSFELGICRTFITIWDREQSRLTFTYIAIVGIFIVLIMPSAFADENISTALFSPDRHSLSIRTLQHVSNFLIWLDLSLNFALYAFINIKFKRAFKIMLRRWQARVRWLFCLCWCGFCPGAGADARRGKWREKNTFYMASHHDEHVPFNNNKNRLESQQSNMSNTSKENSFTTVTFRLTDD